MNRILPLAVLCLWYTVCVGQSLRSYERAGDEAYEKKDYGSALQYYATILDKKIVDVDLFWKYAESARMVYAFSESEKYYTRILQSGKSVRKFPLLYLRLAEIKFGEGQYDEAIHYYQTFLDQNTDPQLEIQAQTGISDAETALQIAGKFAKVEIRHLGKEINSPYSDFAPYRLGDSLFFSSYRFDHKKETTFPKSKITRVMMSVHEGRAREPGRGFPSIDTAHIAHTAFSPDGHFMFFTVCKNKDVNDIRCELWLTVVDRRNKWLTPVRLPDPINLPGYTSTQPSVGYDQRFQGLVLWFASDRPGGKGDTDIWYVPLDTVFFCPCALPIPGKPIPRLPKFTNPIPASSINTPQPEATPFFHSETQTLYFASKGWPGLGAFDLFSSKKTGDTLQVPQNLGIGFNSSYNDVYPYLDPLGRQGYFSSNRPGSYYLDEHNKFCCNDLYAFEIPVDTNSNRKTSSASDERSVLKPIAHNAAKMGITPPQPRPEPVLHDFVGLPLYFDNDEPDKRTLRSTTRKPYEESVLAFLDRQNAYRLQYAAGLLGNAKDVAESEIDDFFELEVRSGYDRLMQMSRILLERLKSGAQVEIQIKGFTSPRAKTDYNLQLGKRRVSSLKNHFSTVLDGALKPYLAKGQLKITELSFGETTANARVSDNLKDERNSIYHPEAARERRVEIIEIKEQE